MASTEPGRGKPALQAPDENAALASESDAPARPPSVVFSGFKLFLGGLLVLSLSVGLFFSVYRYAMTTPRFALEHIEVKGNQRLSETQVVRLAGVEAGQNIFALDTVSAQQRLLAEPWVERARVSRELPATLRIELTEREAVAVALVQGDLFLVTADGEPFKKVQPGESFDLPVITGLSLISLARDHTREVERVGLAVEALRQYSRLEVSRVHPAQEAHLQDDGRVTLVVGRRGMHLELGRGGFRSKLLMAARVLTRLGTKGGQPEVIFLDNEAHPERVVVRLP